MSDSLGIYISVPFCRHKCSFCNFASGVFAAERIDPYIARLEEEIHSAFTCAARLGCELPRHVDTIYLGGGTPSLLEPGPIARIFAALRSRFAVAADAEVTLECAPGQLADSTLAACLAAGVNRLSFGVQSFVDREAAAVGRLHTGLESREELLRMAAQGIARLGVDLICGLPHQTESSWKYTVEQAIAGAVEHVSVYMLEIDDHSRLGREAIAGGLRFGAAELPQEDRVADWYLAACEWLAAAGMAQYEISNFGVPSRHNRRYWQRRPYLGFGLDAHSMLRTGLGGIRWANPAAMDAYVGAAIGRRGFDRTVESVDANAAFEEELFLGLRLVEGVDLTHLRAQFGAQRLAALEIGIGEAAEAGLLHTQENRLLLTPRGRIASNEVFSRLLVESLV